MVRRGPVPRPGAMRLSEPTGSGWRGRTLSKSCNTLSASPRDRSQHPFTYEWLLDRPTCSDMASTPDCVTKGLAFSAGQLSRNIQGAVRERIARRMVCQVRWLAGFEPSRAGSAQRYVSDDAQRQLGGTHPTRSCRQDVPSQARRAGADCGPPATRPAKKSSPQFFGVH